MAQFGRGDWAPSHATRRNALPGYKCMTLPSSHRWIAVGNLVVRKEKRTPPNAPITTLEEFMDEAKQLCMEGNQYRAYGAQKSHLMWFDNFGHNNAYHIFLAGVGDKNTGGVSYIDFETRRSRDIEKEDNEGGHFTAHVAIAKTPTMLGGHLILVERVPGIYLSSIKDHFAWLSEHERLLKPYSDEKRKEKVARAIVEIDGHQSTTIRDALKAGTLQDIEFIQTVEENEDGLDEDTVVKEVVHQATWGIKKKVSDEEAGSVFKSMRSFFRDKFRKGDNDAHMFVRIRTAAGQIKRAEVTDGEEPVLEQAFVHNELISDFNEPLAQRHDGLRDDVVQKILAIPERVERRNGVNADA